MRAPGNPNPLLMAPGLKTLWDILGAASLQGNATLCFDAGDAVSWPGSGQQWIDRSASANNFFVGESASAEGTDPTFTGTVGGLTNATYWALDGGDHFHNAQANAAFMDAWHKDSAAYTFITAVYLPSGAASGGIIGGPRSTATANVSFQLDSGKPTIYVESPPGGAAAYVTADASIASGWHMLAVSINEAAANGFFFADGAYKQVATANTFNATYSSPDSGTSTDTYNIGYGPSNGMGAPHLPAGSRMMGFTSLNKAASKAELDAVFALLRKRLGI
jgi:hypothetical protein